MSENSGGRNDDDLQGGGGQESPIEEASFKDGEVKRPRDWKAQRSK